MGESAISVRNVKIKYRCFKKVSLLKSIFAPRKNKKIEYFEAVKGVSFRRLKRVRFWVLSAKTAAVNLHFLRQSQAFFSPDEGEIDLHGHSISLLSIGVGFQNKLSGRENIFLSGMLLGFERPQIEEKTRRNHRIFRTR